MLKPLLEGFDLERTALLFCKRSGPVPRLSIGSLKGRGAGRWEHSRALLSPRRRGVTSTPRFAPAMLYTAELLVNDATALRSGSAEFDLDQIGCACGVISSA
jgi:hypothetical protein